MIYKQGLRYSIVITILCGLFLLLSILIGLVNHNTMVWLLCTPCILGFSAIISLTWHDWWTAVEIT